MKAASELIREFENSDQKTEEKLSWLEENCLAYERQMPNDVTGQCALYCLLGKEYGKTNEPQKAEAAFMRAKQILEQKRTVRKKVGCGYQIVEQDHTDSREYAEVMKQLTSPPNCEV